MTTSAFGTTASMRPLDECLACASALRPAVGTISNVGQGDFASRNGLGGLIGGSFSIGGFQVDAMSLMSDPIATLAGSCANFLMDHLPPLPQMFKALGGDPKSVQARATQWNSTAERTGSIRAWSSPSPPRTKRFAPRCASGWATTWSAISPRWAPATTWARATNSTFAVPGNVSLPLVGGSASAGRRSTAGVTCR